MATYAEIRDLFNNSDLRNKIEVAYKNVGEHIIGRA